MSPCSSHGPAPRRITSAGAPTSAVSAKRVSRADLLGADADPVTIAWHIAQEGHPTPSTSTIRRVLHQAGLIVPATQQTPPQLLHPLPSRPAQRMLASRHHPLVPRQRHPRRIREAPRRAPHPSEERPPRTPADTGEDRTLPPDAQTLAESTPTAEHDRRARRPAHRIPDLVQHRTPAPLHRALNRPDFRSYREPCPAGAGWPDSWPA